MRRMGYEEFDQRQNTTSKRFPAVCASFSDDQPGVEKSRSFTRCKTKSKHSTDRCWCWCWCWYCLGDGNAFSDHVGGVEEWTEEEWTMSNVDQV